MRYWRQEVKSMLSNPLFLLATCILIGQGLGKISIKHIKLGSSATLFVGLFLSYKIQSKLAYDVTLDKSIFLIALIGFIGSVGLIASKNIKTTLKTYGFKFIILSFFVTGTGAISTYVFMHVLRGNVHSTIGTYVGALTSSPGLAAALELSNQGSDVGLGYAIAYVPGVLTVIFFAQIMKHFLPENHDHIKDKADKVENFSMVAFMTVIVVGIFMGQLKLTTPHASLSLGMTGGVLTSALILGSLKTIGPLSFEFNNKQLSIIRDLSLNMFLAIVGLNYGYKAVQAISSSGLSLLLVGLTTGSLSVVVGLVVGKYILKIKGVYLIGGICGGMTSTPGLAAAIESFDEEKVVAGYGATYPFALIFMIIWTNLLFMGG